MTTTRNGRWAAIAILLALALIIPAAGCDWLDPSGTSSRVSPEISSLVIAPPGVSCGPGSRVGISFDYSDPQDDIRQLLLSFRHTQFDERIDRTVNWDDPAVDLTVSGRASYAGFFFSCGGPSTGLWSVTVRLEDDRGNLSNQLEGEVTLTR